MSPVKVIRQARHILHLLENVAAKDAALTDYQNKIAALLSTQDSKALAGIVIEIDNYFAGQGQRLKNHILESLPYSNHL